MNQLLHIMVKCVFTKCFFAVFSIDCFKCISINKNYNPCEDPFHNNFTTEIYQSPCMGGKKGRDGPFPATFCIKITGVFGEFKENVYILGSISL